MNTFQKTGCFILCLLYACQLTAINIQIGNRGQHSINLERIAVSPDGHHILYRITSAHASSNLREHSLREHSQAQLELERWVSELRSRSFNLSGACSSECQLQDSATGGSESTGVNSTTAQQTENLFGEIVALLTTAHSISHIDILFSVPETAGEYSNLLILNDQAHVFSLIYEPPVPDQFLLCESAFVRTVRQNPSQQTIQLPIIQNHNFLRLIYRALQTSLTTGFQRDIAGDAPIRVIPQPFKHRSKGHSNITLTTPSITSTPVQVVSDEQISIQAQITPPGDSDDSDSSSDDEGVYRPKREERALAEIYIQETMSASGRSTMTLEGAMQSARQPAIDKARHDRESRDPEPDSDSDSDSDSSPSDDN